MMAATPIEQVLDLARWAPSGDNTQPWRFEVTGERSCIVHAFDTRRHCVYDLTGGPSQIAVGAMLETARIAATGLGLRAEVLHLPGDEEHPQFQLTLSHDPAIRADPLIPCITQRCTHRRRYSRRPLTETEKQALEASVGPAYGIAWLEASRRTEVARLLFASARIRLTIPEAYEVHRSIIAWGARYSETKIPDQAVGLDPVGLALMRWAMKSWPRTRFLSLYLGGTLLPRVQLDLLPGLFCAAHVAIIANAPPNSIGDHLDAGAAVQRLWLTATRLGLQHQPEITPLVFAGYDRRGIRFSEDAAALAAAGKVRSRLERLFSPVQAENIVWLGRVGAAALPDARSTRQGLAELSWQGDPDPHATGSR